MWKAAVLLIWAAIIANLLLTLPAALVFPLHLLGAVLLLAHVLEFFLFRQKISAKGDSTATSVVMTLVFGTVYINDL